jgi:hypothetical protein
MEEHLQVGVVVDRMQLEGIVPGLDLELGIPAVAVEPMAPGTPEQRFAQCRGGAGCGTRASVGVGTAAAVARDWHPEPRPGVEHLPRDRRHGLTRRVRTARRSAYEASQAHVLGICGGPRCRRARADSRGVGAAAVVAAAAGDGRRAVHGVEVRAVGWIRTLQRNA